MYHLIPFIYYIHSYTPPASSNHQSVLCISMCSIFYFLKFFKTPHIRDHIVSVIFYLTSLSKVHPCFPKWKDSLLWPNIIYIHLYVYVSIYVCVYPFIHHWTCGLPSFLGYLNNASVNMWVHITFKSVFFSQKWNFWITW